MVKGASKRESTERIENNPIEAFSKRPRVFNEISELEKIAPFSMKPRVRRVAVARTRGTTLAAENIGRSRSLREWQAPTTRRLIRLVAPTLAYVHRRRAVVTDEPVNASQRAHERSAIGAVTAERSKFSIPPRAHSGVFSILCNVLQR